MKVNFLMFQLLIILSVIIGFVLVIFSGYRLIKKYRVESEYFKKINAEDAMRIKAKQYKVKNRYIKD